jgi:hypothetical protein
VELRLLGQDCVSVTLSQAADHKAGSMRSVQSAELVRLDRLLEDLSKETGARCESLREHLESARFYLIGLMPTEYAISLQMAGEALNSVTDSDLRARIESFVRGQEAASRPPRPPD